MGAIGKSRGLTAALAMVVLGALAAAPTTAAAHESGAPVYSLSITEGETTQPEHSIVNTNGRAQQGGKELPLRVSIVHAGAIVAQGKGTGGVWLSQVPQVGDTVTLESPLGTVVGGAVYDGLPSIDPTVCAGSVNFSGERSAGETVSGSFFTEIANASPYGTSYEDKNTGHAQVTALSGGAYGGSFLTPLQFGETVAAEESIEVPLGGGAIFTYQSETVRPVGACPAPPVPPPPPAPVIPPLKAALARFLKVTIASLLKHGWSDRVSVNQAGTVTQDLYLENGALPAHASHARHRKPPALLLARGSASTHAAGTVTVGLHLTSRGRGRLRGAHSVHAVLLTSVRAATGATINLPRRQLTLRR